MLHIIRQDLDAEALAAGERGEENATDRPDEHTGGRTPQDADLVTTY